MKIEKIIGELIYRYELRRLNQFLRRLFHVPPNEWAPWTPDWVPPVQSLDMMEWTNVRKPRPDDWPPG